MSKNWLPATSVAAALAVGAGLLVGCSADDTASLAPGTLTDPVAADTPAPAPVGTPEPAPVAGDTLTSDAEIAVAKASGLSTYGTIDGTTIAVDPTQPLPEPVIADVRAVLGDQTPARDSLERASVRATAYAKVASLGKQLLLILSGGSYDENGKLLEEWVAVGAADGSLGFRGTRYGTVDEALAAAQAVAASNPAKYEIVNLLG